MRIRKSVLDLPSPWDPTILWYAKAVGLMKTRPITDPTSWRYQGAIHDYTTNRDPFKVPGEAMPSPSEQAKYWKRCQHGSWFFLPWHRIYLSFFEKIVAKAVVQLGGPADWALPYWNYSVNANARRLPLAFQSPTMPDGSPNPLFVAQRSPAANANQPVGSSGSSDTSVCLGKQRFVNNPLAQFGGGRTGFSHNGSVAGALEATPHGSMHVAVGGQLQPTQPGQIPNAWMSSFDTAALDPIFWLHHANIDRLWTVWLSATRTNPTDNAWLDLLFDFHDENGAPVQVKTRQVLVTTDPFLDYRYQVVTAVSPVAVPAAAGAGGPVPPKQPDPIPEMAGATSQPVMLGDTHGHAEFAIQAPAGPAHSAAAGLTQRHVHLCLENVKAVAHPIESYEVYVNVPGADDPAQHPDLLAGILPAFGLVEASDPGSEHGGGGLGYSFDITDIVSRLKARGDWNPASLRVSFSPLRTEGDRHERVAAQPVQVGRVSLYYE